MAQIRWYLNNSLLDGWQLVDQSAATAATCNCGWVVGTGSTFSSELQSNTERASTTFVANTVPDGTLDTTLKDAFRSQYAWNGNFAAGNWTFQFAVVSTVQSGAADGQIVFRILKANADGSSATEITTGQQATTIATNVAGTDVNITATWAAPAWSITNQYIFVQIAWKRTGAGGMTTTNIRLRTGSSATVGTTGLTADFAPLQTVQLVSIPDTGSAVSYWPLDEGVGSPTAYDVIGTRHGTIGTGTTCGVAGVTAGPTAMSFDGTDASRMPIPPLPTLYPAFSYEAWINIADYLAGSIIIGRDPSVAGGIRWSVDASTHRHRAQVVTGGNNYTIGTVVPLATWKHLVVTHDGTSCRVYENGVLTTSAGENPLTFALSVSDVPTLSSWLASDTSGTYKCQGKLQDIAVYTRALSAQEVSDHYALRLTGDMTAYRNAVRNLGAIVQAFPPSISGGASPAITTAFRASTAVLNMPTVVPGAVSITTVVRASTAVTNVPTVVPGAVTVTTVFVASTAVLNLPTVAGASLSGFTHYSSVTVNSGQVPSTQTDFPVLVAYTDARFKTVANGGHVQNTSGFDLRPYDSPGVTGGTALTYQLERYNPLTGDLAMWVKVPSLAVGTVIYLRYGDPTLTTDGSSTATWDSNFKGVWHMGQTFLDLSDSTVNGNGLSHSGAVAAAGIYGGVAAYLSGGGGGPLITRSLSPVQAMPVHVSMWLKSPTPGGLTFSSLSDQTSAWDGWYAAYDSTGQASNNTFASGASAAGWIAGAWNYVTYQFISSTLRRVYVNGVAGADDTSGPNTPAFANFQFCLGASMHGGSVIDNYGAATYYDEVRISNVVRSASWIATEYNNQNAPSTFATLGTEIGAGGILSAFLASTLQVFAPVVDGGPNLVTTATVASTLQVFIPIVVNVTAGFTYYLPFTVQAGMVPSTQTDFAVLVSLTDARLKTLPNGGHVQHNLGYDIRPYAGIGTGVTLSYDLEFYDSTVGKLVMWVKVPSLAVGTVIYLYYGDPTITTDGSSTATWDSAFRGVWHTHVVNAGTFTDATGNGNYLINIGGGALVTGQIGTGVNTTDPTGTDPFGLYLRANDPGWFDYVSNPFTLSCWFKPTSLSNASNLQCFVFKGSQNQQGYYGWINNNGAVGFTTNQASTSQSSNAPTGSAAVGVWVFIAVVRSGTSVRIFINGVDATQSAGFHQNPVASNWYFDWGTYNNGNPAYGAPGVYDEPRVSVTNRSADWILTEYKNQFTPTTFITPGTEVPLGGGGGDQTVSGVFIASTAQRFAPTVAVGAVAVTPAFIASAVQVFVPVITAGPVAITTVHRATTVQVFAPTVAPGPVAVTTPGRVTTIQVFAVTVAPGAVGITTATQPTTIQVFAPTTQALVTGVTIVSGSGTFAPSVTLNITTATRPTTIQVFAPTVAPGAVTVTTPPLVTTAQGFAPSVTTGAVSVTTATLATTIQVFAPTVAPGAVTVTTAVRSTTIQVFAPAVAPGAVTITGATLVSTVQMFAPTIAVGPVTVVTPGRVTTIQVFAPTLQALVSGATVLSGSALFAPTVVQSVTTAHRATTIQVFTPTVVLPAVQPVTTVAIPTGSVVNAPTIAVGPVTVLAATIAATTQMFLPTVAVAAVQSVTLVHRATTVVLNGPTITVGAVTVVTVPIVSTAQLFLPIVSPAGVVNIGTGTVPTTVQMFPPTLTTGAVTITTAHRPTTVVMFVPTVTALVSGATIVSGSSLFAPTVVQVVTTVTRPTTVQVFAPTLAVQVTGAFRASTAALFAPTLSQAVTTAFRGAVAVLYPPIVLPTGALGGPTALSTLQVFPPTVSSAAVGVGGAFIGSLQSIAAPSVSTLTFVTTAPRPTTVQLFPVVLIAKLDGTFIASTNLLFPPAVRQTVIGGTISAGSRLFTPLIDTGTGLTVGFISSTEQLFGPSVSTGAAQVTVGGLTSTARLFPPSLGGFLPGTCVTSGISIRSLMTSATMTHAVAVQGSVQVRYLSTATMAHLGVVVLGSVQIRSLVVSDGVQGGCCKEALVP